MSSRVFDHPAPPRPGTATAEQQPSCRCPNAATPCITGLERVSMLQKFIGVLRWWSASVGVALALAGCGGGGEPVSSRATPAGLDQVAALTLAQQSVNARVALPHAPARAALSPGTASEDFEGGMSDWSNWGNAQVVPGAASSGSKAMQVGTGAGGAGLIVPGIVPGTVYRLTAQVKVSDPSETVFIGINMLSSAGSHVIGQSAPAVTSTGYASVTVDLVAPAESASAVVWAWKNAGSGYGYMDDVVFGPATNPPPPPPPPPLPGSNLVSNGGLESGMSGWVSWGNASVVSGQASSGVSALSVGTAAGGAGHDVGGIVPGTIYRLAAQAKVSAPSETLFVGVNLLNQAGTPVAQMALTVSGTSYGTATFDVTAPLDAVKAVVYVWKNDGSGFGYVDDVVFGVASAPLPPAPSRPSANLVVNGGFEDGLVSWVDWGNSTVSIPAAADYFAAQVGPGAGGFGQDIGGIAAGNTYRLGGLAKVSSPGEIGYLGVRFTDDAGTRLLEQNVPFSSTEYSIAQLDVVAPANATRALVYVWKNASIGFSFVDEIALEQIIHIVPLTVTSEQVNPVEPGRQYFDPAIVRLTGGGSVIAWAALPPTEHVSTGDMCYQVYDASGARIGASSCVSGAHRNSSGPLLRARADGGFTIVWNESNLSPDPSGLRRQDYDATGNAQGPIQAGWLPNWLSAQPLAGGGFVKLLQPADGADTVAFQLYGSDGTPIGSLQPVGAGESPSAGGVVGLTGGGFAVSWVEYNGSSYAAMTRAFSAAGAPVGGPVAVAPNTLGSVTCGKYEPVATCPAFQNASGIIATDDGGYIVGWADGTSLGSAGDTFARQFRADGRPANAVIGRIGIAFGPMAAVGADSFVMAIANGSAVSALHVVDTPLR